MASAFSPDAGAILQMPLERQPLRQNLSVFFCQVLGECTVLLYLGWSFEFAVVDHPSIATLPNEEPSSHRASNKFHCNHHL